MWMLSKIIQYESPCFISSSKAHFKDPFCLESGKIEKNDFSEIPCSKSLPLQYVYMAALPSVYKTSVLPLLNSVPFLFVVVCSLKWSQAYLSKTQHG